MDAKAAFEKWFSENMYLADKCFCTEPEKRRMFKAWTASRVAIEIELDGEVRSGDDYYDDGYRAATDAAEEAITSHGIRIKGKTE